MGEEHMPRESGWKGHRILIQNRKAGTITGVTEVISFHPEEILLDNKETCIRIPMLDDIRSLNLSNSVAIVLYEALRQNEFANFQMEGQLHRYEW